LSDFYALTPWELVAAAGAKNRSERKGWEQTRMMMYAMLLPYQDKNKNLKPKDVLSLNWDDETTPKKPKKTAEELAEADRKRKERFAKWDAEMVEQANG
jgi:hypothetical protein